ncbi:hypothetical protein J7I98_11820 [Streptomyces sp. ISL-98]|uniref:hypothetical protein n=1 Tax=Streptomyces sp. ISL-98 TaxID=2819192 RepID=UPI001BEB94D2|nr:hypothetical protein [Streptomyces sp. ISL-98]MBT2506572.1 hypothetical protein [Streptomyces sp. ISL-98]
MSATTWDDTPVAMEGGGVELRLKDIGGDMAVSFVRLPRGTDMAPALQGLPDDSCQCPHWGYVLKGRLRMRTKDGESFYSAGDAYYWSPGHIPEALEDVEFVEFSPMEELNKVIDHVKAQMS